MANAGTKKNPWIKDPDSTRTFGVDWTTWLDGDTLSASTWTVVSGSVVIVTNTSNTTVASVKLSGGLHGEKCVLRNRVTTAAGETGDQTVHLLVRNK